MRTTPSTRGVEGHVERAGESANLGNGSRLGSDYLMHDGVRGKLALGSVSEEQIAGACLVTPFLPKDLPPISGMLSLWARENPRREGYLDDLFDNLELLLGPVAEVSEEPRVAMPLLERQHQGLEVPEGPQADVQRHCDARLFRHLAHRSQ